MNISFVGMTGAVVILFIAILVMYTYVQETRDNQQELKKTQNDMNSSLNMILQKQAERWQTDNVRFNATLLTLGETYKEIQSLSNIIEANTNRNLNLTKFNRAALVDTNHLIRELAEVHNIEIHPFNASNIG